MVYWLRSFAFVYLGSKKLQISSKLKTKSVLTVLIRKDLWKILTIDKKKKKFTK